MLSGAIKSTGGRGGRGENKIKKDFLPYLRYLL
jgi:hypothetical protein